MGASGDLLVDLFPADLAQEVHVLLTEHLVLFVLGERYRDLADASDKGDNLHAVRLFQVLLSDGASGHTSDRLSCRGSTTPGRRFDAVLDEVGVVGVRGSWVQIRLGVVVWSLIFVVDEETDWRAKRHSVLGSTLDVDLVVFRSLQQSH